ncbi:MAG TPA: amidohydrolase [Actinomycetes bacterium]|nr:amidohydrolase [Actinomycetes bacterium]
MSDLTAELVVRGGRIWTGVADTPPVTALAVRDGRIAAIGTDDELAPLTAGAAQVIDLQGKVLLPGLQDSHIHAVRAGLTWDRELHWEDVRSLPEALETVRARAAETAPGTWIIVIGGWHERQLAERRMPTRAELDAAAPGSPVFVQMLYDVGMLSSAALKACGWDAASADPPGGVLERDSVSGELTGRVTGMGAFGHVLSQLPEPTYDEKRGGTVRMLAEMASHGITAVIDGGGFRMPPESYHPLLDLWRTKSLPVRMRLFMSAATRGAEVAELAQWIRHVAPGFGDDVVRISGLGEITHYGCHDMEGLDPYEMSDEAWHELVEISRAAAARGWTMSMHAVLDHTLGRVLDAWELVARDHDLRPLRFSIVHADEASLANIDRIAKLGVGVLVQDRLVLKASDYVDSWGADATARTPPLGDLVGQGVPIAAGTDADRANWWHPWASIWWLVTGESVDGAEPRAPRHRLSIEDALRAYSHGGAWFTFEEASRGLLVPGHAADFFVPTADPFAVEPEALPGIRSELTVMGGQVTHSAGALTDAGPARA